MTLRKAVLVQLAAFLASVVASLVYFPFLPDRVPTHWGISGQPDAWGSKWINLLMMPGLLLLFAFLTVLLPTISPKGFRPDASGRTYGYVMALLSGLFLVLHLIILQASTGNGPDMGRTMIAALFLFFALIGNVLGRVKRNFWVGVRTPWTLADERVWRETHRSAGKLWLVGGLAGTVLAILGTPPPILFALMLVIAFIPIAQSYVIWRRLSP